MKPVYFFYNVSLIIAGRYWRL